MKQLSTFFLFAILSVPSYAEFCDFPYSEPIEGEIAVVGQAMDWERERFKVLNAFKGNLVQVGGGYASLNASLARHYEDIYERTYMKKGGKFGIGPFKFGESREFVTEVTRKKYTATFMLQFDATLPNDKWEIDSSGGTPLTDYATSLLDTPCEFKQVFGDSFIFQTQRGVSVYVAINVSFSSQENYESFKRSMEAGLEYEFKGWTGSFCGPCKNVKKFTIPPVNFSASFEKASENVSRTIREDAKIELVAMQIGGDASGLGQVFGNPDNGVSLTSCSLNALDKCDKAFDNVLSYLAQEEFAEGVKESPAVLNYLYRPYWEIDPSIQLVNEVTPEIEAAREQLAQELLNRSRDLRLLKNTLSNPLTTPAHEQQLIALDTALTWETGELITAGFTCFSDLHNCVRKAKQILTALKAYDPAAVFPTWQDGLMTYFPFDKENQSLDLLTNSYPFAGRLYGDINWQNPWYASWPERIFKDKPLLVHNNTASSSTVFPGCRLNLFDGANYRGWLGAVAKHPNFTWKGWNDKPSSAKLRCPASTETTLDNAGKHRGAVYKATLAADRYGNPEAAYNFEARSMIDIPGSLIAPRMTVSAWVNPANHKDGVIVGRVSDKWDHQYALKQSGNLVNFNIRRTDNCKDRGWHNWYKVSADAPLPLDEWSLVTGTWDGEILRIYVNGELKGARTDVPAGGISDCNSGSTRIGFWFDLAVRFFTGSIDDVYLYNRALSKAEIEQLYDMATPDTNLAPLASFTSSVMEGASPLTVDLNAGSSDDTDGVISSYQWAAELRDADGNTLSRQTADGMLAQFVFTEQGAYTVALTVTDDKGKTSQSEKKIVVGQENIPENQPPAASFTLSPNEGKMPLTVNLDAGASIDPDGVIVQYSWKASDGQVAEGVTATFTFDIAGTWTVTLTVMDNNSAVSTHEEEIAVTIDDGSIFPPTSCRAQYSFDGKLYVPCVSVPGAFGIRRIMAAELRQQPFTLGFELNPLTMASHDFRDECLAGYSAETGQLHLPCIQVPGYPDYDVDMQQKSGALLFDVINIRISVTPGQ